MPAPFGPDDADRLAGADGKVDAIEHQKRAEALRQAFRLKQKAVRPRARHRRPRRRGDQLLNGRSFAWIGTFGSVAFSVTG